MARKDFKFEGKNLTLDLNKMSRLSSGEKMSILNDRSSRDMLSSLTAQQFASTFPEYYKKSLPDVGANLPSVRSLSPLSASSSQSMRQDTARQYRENERIKTNRKDMATPIPPWMRKVQAESGVNVSDPKAVAQLSNERRKLLKDMEQGNISADDPKVAFLKDMSDEDLRKSGIKREKTASGDVSSYSRSETSSAKLTDEEVTNKLKSSSAGGFSPRERATLDMIAKREGSKNADIIFGDKGNVPGTGPYSKALGLDKRPLSDHSISEVLELQPKLTRITRQDGVGGGRGTSAVGTGQMIRGTLLANLRELGIPESEWPKLKFDKTLQERLTLQNFKTFKIGDPNADPSTWDMGKLGAQYESLDTRKGFRSLSQAEMQSIASASPNKVIGPITQESITAERKRLEEQERQYQETFLAGRTVPKLPEGVDPKFAEMFERMSPGQKQRNLEAIAKIGATKFNEIYQSASTSPELIRNKNESVDQLAERIKILQPNLKNEQCVNLARQIVGSKESVTTWRRGKSVQDGDLEIGTPIATFMDQDTARDSKYYAGGRGKVGKPGADTTHAGVFAGYITDKDGKRIGIKIFEQYTGSGGPKQSTLYFDDDRKRIKNASRYYAINNSQGNLLGEENNPTHIAKIERDAKEVEAKNAEAKNAEAKNAEAKNAEAKNAEAKKTASAPPTPTAPVAAPVAPVAAPAQATQTATAPPAANTIPTIQSFAEGGRGQLGSDEIRAMPIKNIKSDNSVVVDKKDNPIFTMNTKQENAKFDPLTRQVSVSPINRETPEDLMNSDNNNNTNSNNRDGYDNDSNENNAQNFSQQMQRDNGGDSESVRREAASSMTSMTSDIFKDPSFKRAVAKTRFVDSGDHSLGGHFGSSNADLS